jgi:hypothetical protein
MTPEANFATSFASVVGKLSTSVNDTGGKFATGVNVASGNLPPVATKPAGKFATGENNTDDKQWEQLSDCWQLKINLKTKIYLNANSNIQRCPKEKMKIFLI